MATPAAPEAPQKAWWRMEFVEARGALIPQVGLGTWRLAGASCAAAVSEALRLGYRHIDTATLYNNEEMVGAAVRASSVDRDEIFITTKVSPENIGEGSLQRSVESSLRRLGLSQVDLVLIHWPNPRIPLRESMQALAETRRRGLTRHIGVSNYDAPLMAEAQALCDEPLVANQAEYHPYLDQDALLAACRASGIAFVSYSPLARRDVVYERTLQDIARRHRKTPAQIVLRWHVQQGCVVIPKSGNPARIAENLALFDFALGPDEMAAVFALRA